MGGLARSMGLTPHRRRQLTFAACIAAAAVASLWLALDIPATSPWMVSLVLVLFAANALWLSSSAMAVLTGLPLRDRARGQQSAEPGPCAIVWLICGEDCEALARRIDDLLQGLERDGVAGCDVFVLSDTSDPDARVRELSALSRFGARIGYRNRARAIGRKPGNLLDWLDHQSGPYDTMLVLDADSGFSASRLQALRHRMAADARLGLVQSGIRIRPGTSRLAALQRLSSRICGPAFVTGLARLSGDAGNYWGHNALIRVAAFREVTPLPRLSGSPPFGGDILSHDFVEAAFLRRAGWGVEIVPDGLGSTEAVPETVAQHARRDRRWCQGNLQHLRIVAARGLHPESRLHLVEGIQSYLSAPVWLTLVLLFGSGAVHSRPGLVWPLMAMVALLAVPKVAGLLHWQRRSRSRRARRIIQRAALREIVQSTLFAPLVMIRQTASVAAVLIGRDCGWSPAATSARAFATGRPEAVAGLAILGLVMAPQAAIAGGARSAVLAGLAVLPVVLPLVAAPWLIRWFDGPARTDTSVADYYDASTRRFLLAGGSGRALAIHRPLWAEGVRTPEEAASHINDLIALEAERTLGRQPRVVCDMGCGVGGTVLQLAARWPGTGFLGVTISRQQAVLGRAFAKQRGLSDCCTFLATDYTAPGRGEADLVVAVESHVHAASALRFLSAARGHLAAGGVLIIVDDMPARRVAALPRDDRALMQTLRRGWRLGHVTPADDLIDQARALGFAEAGGRDLSGLLRLERRRDIILRLVGPVADRLGLSAIPLFANMIGGNALTEAYRRGAMQYRMVVFRDVAEGGIPLVRNAAA